MDGVFMRLIWNHALALTALSVACSSALAADAPPIPPAAPTTAPSTQPAEPSTQPVIAGDVAALISKLADPVWREREIAEKTLVAMGSSAVPSLKAALHGDLDDEARHRIESALVKIDEIGETGPSRITLDLENIAPRDFFAELSKQIRSELLPAQPDLWESGNFNARASFHFENASFWQVMKEVQEKYNLELVQWNDGIRLMPAGNGNGMLRGPNVVSGPFMVVAQQVFRSQTADLANGGGTQSEFYIRFMGFSEPKLRIMQASSEMQVEEAIDENGNSLAPGNNTVNSGFASGINGAWSFIARLRFPAENPGHKIVKIKGSLPIVLQTGYEAMEVEDPLNKKNIQKTLGGVRFEMKDLVKNADHYTLRLAATMSPENYARIQGLIYNMGGGGSDMKLVDENGQAYQASSKNVTQNNNTFEATIDFVPGPSRRAKQKTPGPPVKLTLKVPTETKNISIPVEFEDIPIP